MKASINKLRKVYFCRMHSLAYFWLSSLKDLRLFIFLLIQYYIMLTTGNSPRCYRHRRHLRRTRILRVSLLLLASSDDRLAVWGCALPHGRVLVSWPVDIRRIHTEHVWLRTSNGTPAFLRCHLHDRHTNEMRICHVNILWIIFYYIQAVSWVL